MAKFKEGKIPYFNKLKYLSEEKQAEGIAILERAQDNRDKIMYDRFRLKNTQRSIEYTSKRLFELRVEEWQLKVKLSGVPIPSGDDEDEDEELDGTPTPLREEYGDEIYIALNAGDNGYGVPDYEGEDEDEDETEDDLI